MTTPWPVHRKNHITLNKYLKIKITKKKESRKKTTVEIKYQGRCGQAEDSGRNFKRK